MTKKLTEEEMMLVLLYGGGSRKCLIRELTEMKKHLQHDEEQLAELADSVIKKVSSLSDGDFEELLFFS